MGQAVKVFGQLLGISLLALNASVAQPWEDILDAPLGFIYGMTASESELYLAVQISGQEIPNQVHEFDGASWSHLSDTVFGNGQNPIRGLSIYQGTPYCYHLGDLSNRGVHMYDGARWQLIGEMPFGMVQGTKVFNDTLYIFGQFREINGDTNLRDIVKYDGEHFTPVGTPLFYSTTVGPVVMDIHFYQGDLHVVGRLKTASGKYHTARWDGQQWNDVGDGFPYSSYPSKLLEYNGYLLINQSPVNYSGTSNGLVAWDGQQYHGMGQITCDHLAGVSHMTVHDGKLWVAGDCSDNPGFHHYFASYDGERWCEYGFVENAKYMTAFQDRMYAYLLQYVQPNNQPVHRFVRWLDGTEPDWCGEPTYMGVEDVANSSTELTISPNPTTSTTTLTWQGQSHGNYQLQLYDVHGRQVLQGGGAATTGSNTLTIDMSAFAKGIYFGRFVVGEETRSFKMVKE